MGQRKFAILCEGSAQLRNGDAVFPLPKAAQAEGLDVPAAL